MYPSMGNWQFNNNRFILSIDRRFSIFFHFPLSKKYCEHIRYTQKFRRILYLETMPPNLRPPDSKPHPKLFFPPGRKSSRILAERWGWPGTVKMGITWKLEESERDGVYGTSVIFSSRRAQHLQVAVGMWTYFQLFWWYDRPPIYSIGITPQKNCGHFLIDSILFDARDRTFTISPTWRIIPVSKWLGSPRLKYHSGHLKGE